MLSAIRSRITYVNVVATLVLVFTMTGGAYAAKKYLITSTKQISPSVLKALQGKAGLAGANGAQGPAGVAGPQGPAGAAGSRGETGSAGKEGSQGKEGKEGLQGKEGKSGKEGKEGSPWTAGGTLPSGSTEAGAWEMPNSASKGSAALSFTIPLAAQIEATNALYLKEGFPSGATAEEIEECPGSAKEPKAKKGFLCVYTGWGEFIGGVTQVQKAASNAGGASTAGAILVTTGAVEGELRGIVTGTWAVTAP
jgi:hypothetical protein